MCIISYAIVNFKKKSVEMISFISKKVVEYPK